jgi:cytochrome c biogenesis protein CcdA
MFGKYRNLILLTAVAVFLIGGVLILKSTNWGAQALWNISDGGKWLFPLVTVGALIDSVNPCAFSILLLTVAFFVSVGAFRSNILKFGAVYIIGLFVSYFLIGLGIFSAFHLFETPKFMAKIGASLLIILGILNILKDIFPQLPFNFNWLMKLPKGSASLISKLVAKGSLPAIFGIGVVVGLCEFPCTGGPYLMVLGLLHDYSTYLKGLAYLFYYNIIFILPLVVILMLASNKALIEKIQAWQREERKIAKWGLPLAMIVLGITIFFL